jgi:hypothetical protein
MELLGGLADGEPAMNFEYGHSARYADIDFHGHSVSHSALSIGSVRKKMTQNAATLSDSDAQLPQGIIR